MGMKTLGLVLVLGMGMSGCLAEVDGDTAETGASDEAAFEAAPPEAVDAASLELAADYCAARWPTLPCGSPAFVGCTTECADVNASGLALCRCILAGGSCTIERAVWTRDEELLKLCLIRNE